MSFMKQTFYFDFSKKGQDVLGTKDVPVLKNEQSVRESVINLLSTDIGMRPMIPKYGVDLNKYLFEPIDEITSDLLSFEIQKALETYIPRIENIDVVVNPSEDELTYIINISYRVKYTGKQEVIEIDFNKIR